MVCFFVYVPRQGRSPSSRRAWVEITPLKRVENRSLVALLAEGVGRNPIRTAPAKGRRVALLAEGVGRNSNALYMAAVWLSSPSSRRAWVEISKSRW